jgi:hypothetical protein
MTRRPAALVAAVAALALLAPAAAQAASTKPFRGGGTWVDIYDGSAVWRNPEAVIDDLAYQGVKTLYLETGNFHFRPRKKLLAHPEGLARFVDAAHLAGIRVVGWYLAGLADFHQDRRRILAALRFRTVAGQRFDAFALDIESGSPASISRRNAAAVRLSRAARKWAGRKLPLGAIVPDSRSTSFSTSLWPGFPYRSLRRYYDVFMPMAYSTYRAHGARAVYRYTRANIDLIRARTGDARVPIHVIGGLASGLHASEANAVVRAANRGGAIGASFYSYDLTRQKHWDALVRLR